MKLNGQDPNGQEATITRALIAALDALGAELGAYFKIPDKPKPRLDL